MYGYFHAFLYSTSQFVSVPISCHCSYLKTNLMFFLCNYVIDRYGWTHKSKFLIFFI